MSHTLTYNPDAHWIETKIQGDLTLKEVKEIFAESTSMVETKNCSLFLSDYREAVLKLSTINLYELPGLLANGFASSEHKASQLKRALVVARDLEDYQFFENVTVNAGQNTKTFYDIDEAKKWLSGK